MELFQKLNVYTYNTKVHIAIYMSINEDIRQAKFESEIQKLHINILYTASWLDNQMSNILTPFELSPEQYNVLRILRGAKKCVNLKYISERLINKQSNTSRLIDKLVAKKMIDRHTSSEDRRNINLTITQYGLDIVGEIAVMIVNFHKELTHVKEQEASEVSDVLDKLRWKKKN